MPVIPARLAAGACAALVSAGLVFGGGVAAADTPDAENPLCVTLADRTAALPALEADKETSDQAVADARAAVAAAESDLNAIGADEPGFADAQQELADAREALTEALEQFSLDSSALATAQTAESTARQATVDAGLDCTETEVFVEPTTPTTEPTPDPEPTPAPGDNAQAVFDRISGQITNLSCDAYNEELGAITDDLFAFETFQLLGGERTGALQDQLQDRNAALGFCFGTPGVTPNPGTPTTPAPDTTTTTVINLDDVVINPVDDDDSTAIVYGDQVTVAPEGSASTGGA